MEAMVRRVYNNGVFGAKKSLDFDKVIFLQEGDKVPGDVIKFQLLFSGTIPIGFSDTQTLFEVGSYSEEEPGFTYKIVVIPYGTYINKEEMVVERY